MSRFHSGRGGEHVLRMHVPCSRTVHPNAGSSDAAAARIMCDADFMPHYHVRPPQLDADMQLAWGKQARGTHQHVLSATRMILHWGVLTGHGFRSGTYGPFHISELGTAHKAHAIRDCRSGPMRPLRKTFSKPPADQDSTEIVPLTSVGVVQE